MKTSIKLLTALLLMAILPVYAQKGIVTGADQTEAYVQYLKGKNVGMVINQTSVIGAKLTPSVDSLLKLGVSVKKIFGPEHGFRGNAADGANINSTVDAKTGIPIVSLYGSKHYKPTPEELKGLDIIVFDIQDVGARFYTYISTLHYVMEACAENHIELMILDRPNPNGNYVDGPVLLDTALHSFVGMHPIPVTHGMTIAEYAQMINGEGWLNNHVQCKLKIIKVKDYAHSMFYRLPVNPSPNLQSQTAINLYPSVCFVEGTNVSLGRGTTFPFEVFGSPLFEGKYRFTFTPKSIPGVSDNPPLKDKLCYGRDLRNAYMTRPDNIKLELIIEAYKAYPDKAHFFTAYFTKLAGTKELQKQIEAGMSETAIRKSWEPALGQYKQMRKKYLLYK